MILSYSRDSFVKDILLRKKRHTIRADKHNRWHVGRKIHFWRGNPRNTRGKNKPYQFATGVVQEIKRIVITHAKTGSILKNVTITVDGISLNKEEQEGLAYSDGFSCLTEFLLWFDKDFTGKLIIWEQETLTRTNTPQ